MIQKCGKDYNFDGQPHCVTAPCVEAEGPRDTVMSNIKQEIRAVLDKYQDVPTDEKARVLLIIDAELAAEEQREKYAFAINALQRRLDDHNRSLSPEERQGFEAAIALLRMRP